MIIRQSEQTILILGKLDDVTTILREAIKLGYGLLPAIWAIKLYLERN